MVVYWAPETDKLLSVDFSITLVSPRLRSATPGALLISFLICQTGNLFYFQERTEKEGEA